MKVILTIKIVIKGILWVFLFFSEINLIMTENILGQKRKNEEIQE